MPRARGERPCAFGKSRATSTLAVELLFNWVGGLLREEKLFCGGCSGVFVVLFGSKIFGRATVCDTCTGTGACEADLFCGTE